MCLFAIVRLRVRFTSGPNKEPSVRKIKSKHFVLQHLPSGCSKKYVLIGLLLIHVDFNRLDGGLKTLIWI